METTDSQRIKNVMNYLKCGNPTAFSKLIEIGRQNIYDVKNEKYGITAKIAKAINDKYPEISLEWLLYGKGEMIVQENILNESPESYNKCKECKRKDRIIDDLLEEKHRLKKLLEDCLKKLPVSEEKRNR
jgi:hypothetical protein